jgi:hypothetical protein
MPLCPVCNKKLKQDFGMVTCQNCKSVLMIDINGQVQVGREIIVEEETDFEQNDFNNEDKSDVFEDNVLNNSDNINDIDLNFDSQNEDTMNPQFDDNMHIDTNTAFDPNSTFQEESSLINPLDLDKSMGDGFTDANEESLIPPDDYLTNDDSNPIGLIDNSIENNFVDIPSTFSNIQEEDEAAVEMLEEADEEPVNITQFANSEDSNLEEGEYLYDIKISRIDSKELRDELKAVLQDEKLKLNFHEYIRKIKDGKVTIANLNPIKAKRIIEQLQYLDLQLHWSQKRVVMQKEVKSSLNEEEGEDSIEDVIL